ncbi:MAG: hypothetical protein ABR991_12700, partial [Terracidiphilus sp.]
NVDPGQYTITVTAAQFAKYEDKNVVVLARETTRSDISLSVQGAQQTVVVEGGQSVVSEDLTQSASLSGTEIESLALNFRATNAPSPIGTAVLTPTVSQDTGGNLTFAGQVPTATSFSLDGISVQLTRFGGPTKDLFPSVEAIDEFRVNAAGNSAEYAQATDLTVTTKSGSNKYHGSGFWFAQRKGWNSNDLIEHYVPNGNANTFGVSASGPLWKEKTFFYFDYEGVRLANNTGLTEQTIPAAWANGDFSGANLPGKPPLTLVQPGSISAANPNGTPLPSNNLSGLGISANPIAAIAFQKLFPTPVGAYASVNNIDNGENNYQATFPGQYTSNVYDGRIDQVIGQHHRIFGRVTKKNISVNGTDSATGDSSYNPLMGTFTTGSDLTNVAFSHNWIINSHLLNEARGGWSTMNFSYIYPQAQQGDSIISAMQTAGLAAPAGITLGHPVNALGGVPVFYVGNLIGGQSTGSNPYGGHPRMNNNSVVEIGDILTWSRSHLNVKVGGSFRRVGYRDNITFLEGDEYGDYYNDGAIPCTSAQSATYFDACSVAELYLGLQDGTSLAQNGPDGKPYSHHFDGFGQFEWKINERLTLNMGLRYEVNTPFIDETNQLGNFDTDIPHGELIVNPNEKISNAWAESVGDIPGAGGALPTIGTATGIPGIPFAYANSVGLPAGLRYLDNNNVQPRAGVIWKPFKNHEALVKASGGLYSVPVLGAVLYSLLGVDTSNFGSYNAGPLASVFAGTGSAGAFPGYRRANQWDLKDPSVGQWTLSVEQNIGFRTDLKLTYTGSRSWNLIYSPDLNQVVPNTATVPAAYANYINSSGQYSCRTGGTASGALVTGYASLTCAPDLRLENLKFPNFREVLTRANGPWDNYNAFTVEANRRFAKGVSFTNAYTFTSNNTNALGTAPNSAIATGGQGDNGGNVNNVFDIKSDYGHAFYDPRHKLVTTFVYSLPFGHNQQFFGSVNQLTDRLIGGWSITGINLYHSGFWLTPYYPSGAYDASGTKPGNRSVSQQRPDVVAGVSPFSSQRLPGQLFYSGAFAFPCSANANGTANACYSAPSAPIGRFGNAGVGILEGPSTETYSMSIGKNVPLAEHFVLRYEAQVSNLFNFVNGNIPNMNITSGNSFGTVTSSQTGSQAGPRTIQMSLRLSY